MQVNTLILGAGAAGLMCAAHAGPDTMLVDHAKAPCEKIRISGGGRCNFTNMYAGPANFLSGNPHFCKSALSRYTQWDFLDLVNRHGIAYHEKSLGQLFCDNSAKQIVQMLVDEAKKAGTDLWLRTSILNVTKTADGFAVAMKREGKVHKVTCRNLVLATGGKSIPKMGATGLAYQIAAQFDVPVTDTRAGLVPFTFSDAQFAGLSGLALPVQARAERGDIFPEALLFTHRGLSGPAMLQISSFWQDGEQIHLDLDPSGQLLDTLRQQRQTSGRHDLKTELSRHLPARLVDFLADDLGVQGRLADQNDDTLTTLVTALRDWCLKPTGTEGYRTAEVTLGGIDTNALSSKTMEVKALPGLYVIGEAVDVTGWLGGYNFQWAWSSGHAAGNAIQNRA